MKPFEAARKAFDSYCALNTPHLPEDTLSAAQVVMLRWVNSKVKHSLPGSVEYALGASEELGEYFELKAAAAIGRIAHIELNVSQTRRYSDLSPEELQAKKADAIADAAAFLMNLCTVERLDFATLLRETVLEVVQRDWLKYPTTAAEVAEKKAGKTRRFDVVYGAKSKLDNYQTAVFGLTELDICDECDAVLHGSNQCFLCGFVNGVKEPT